jgi:hypothetical protein
MPHTSAREGCPYYIVVTPTGKPVEQINWLSAEIEIILVCAYKQPVA